MTRYVVAPIRKRRQCYDVAPSMRVGARASRRRSSRKQKLSPRKPTNVRSGRVAVAVGYIALFGIAVETGGVMVVYLHGRWSIAALPATLSPTRMSKLQPSTVRCNDSPTQADDGLRRAGKSGAHSVDWGIGSDVMKPITAPIVGGMITSTIHVLILVPVFFVMMKERALKRDAL
jgi:Cu(I)/Ag(I) efflux system membrane protein CusA/SilA